ncbi:hypothetical protein ADUPG1_003979, partial [Aduncisulcus paluster]
MQDPLMPPTHERTVITATTTEVDSRVNLRELIAPAEIKDGEMRDYILSISSEEDINIVMRLLSKEAKRRWKEQVSVMRHQTPPDTQTANSIPRRIASIEELPSNLPPALAMTLHYSILSENIPMINRL